MNTIVIGNIFAFVGRHQFVAGEEFMSKILGCLPLFQVHGFLDCTVGIEQRQLFKINDIVALLSCTFRQNGHFANNVAACLFTWYLDSDSEILLKVIIILSEIMWSIFDFTIHNYVALVMDLLTVVTNTIGIVMLKQGKIKTKPTVM